MLVLALWKFYHARIMNFEMVPTKKIPPDQRRTCCVSHSAVVALEIGQIFRFAARVEKSGATRHNKTVFSVGPCLVGNWSVIFSAISAWILFHICRDTSRVQIRTSHRPPFSPFLYKSGPSGTCKPEIFSPNQLWPQRGSTSKRVKVEKNSCFARN